MNHGRCLLRRLLLLLLLLPGLQGLLQTRGRWLNRSRWHTLSLGRLRRRLLGCRSHPRARLLLLLPIEIHLVEHALILGAEGIHLATHGLEIMPDLIHLRLGLLPCLGLAFQGFDVVGC